jgi:hypothetical protein
MKTLRAAALMIWLPALLSLAACHGVPSDRPQKAYLVPDDGTPAARHAPVFVLERYDPPYNRIGTPAARLNSDGREQVVVDSSRATIYVQTQRFETARGGYTNLIYRIHFERVPGWHLTAGHNVGVFVIVTLDAAGNAVLVTTVHTCGCYQGFIPAGDLPPKAYPSGWPTARHSVYGEDLPARLNFHRPAAPDERLVIFIRAEVHRVMDADVETLPAIRERFDLQPAALQPMEALQALPLDGAATSFYYTEGGRKGYVKDSRKPFEMFFMGWWAVDFYVGRDKELGDAAVTGARLYTSLKFWNRRASDLYRFPRFLAFWGWGL